MTNRLERILQHIPGFRAAEQAVQQQAVSHRAELIEQVREHRDRAERAESHLAAAAASLNTKASKLREQLAVVESEILTNLQARNAARSSADAAIQHLQVELRSEVQREVGEFKRSIEHTREALHLGLKNARYVILGVTGGERQRTHSNTRITSALAVLLDAYAEVDAMAISEPNVEAAIAHQREKLANAGIRLIDSSTQLH